MEFKTVGSAAAVGFSLKLLILIIQYFFRHLSIYFLLKGEIQNTEFFSNMQCFLFGNNNFFIHNSSKFWAIVNISYYNHEVFASLYKYIKKQLILLSKLHAKQQYKERTRSCRSTRLLEKGACPCTKKIVSYRKDFSPALCERSLNLEFECKFPFIHDGQHKWTHTCLDNK